MNRVREYTRPASLEAALELLARPAPVTRPLAGGTYLALAGTDAEVLVDLAGLGLSGIAQAGDRVTLGAMTTLQELADASAVCPELQQAARREAPRNIRRQATLGGSIAAGYSGPLLACLLALDAELVLEPGTRALPLVDYLAQRHSGKLSGLLIVSLSFHGERRLGYAEIARTPTDAPILCVAVGGRVADGRLAQVALACGGAGQPLVTSPHAADRLEGAGAREAAGLAAASAADWTVDWTTDARAQGSYRQSMLPVVLGRAVGNLVAQGER